jgi:hypothetical protein
MERHAALGRRLSISAIPVTTVAPRVAEISDAAEHRLQGINKMRLNLQTGDLLPFCSHSAW